MITGQAKTDYQRDYMRRYRAKNRDSALSGHNEGLKNAPESPTINERKTVRPKPPLLDPVESVRPETLDPVRPKGCSGCELLSHNPKSGLSCPQGKHATGVTFVFEQQINPNKDCQLRNEIASADITQEAHSLTVTRTL